MILNLAEYLRGVDVVGLDVDGPVYPFGDCMERWLLGRPCAANRTLGTDVGPLASFNLTRDEFFHEMEAASQDGMLYLSGTPYEDAVQWLPVLVDHGVGIHLVTARSQVLADAQTRQWFTSQRLPFDHLTLSVNKHEVGGFDVLYDDDVNNVRSMIDHGRRAVVAARDWNDGVDDLPRATWEEFVTALLSARITSPDVATATMASA